MGLIDVRVIKDAVGNTLELSKDILWRWKEYFKVLVIGYNHRERWTVEALGNAIIEHHRHRGHT